MADQPIGHWALPPYLDIDTDLGVGVVAFDRTGIQRVQFGVTGFQPVPVPLMSLNPSTGGWEYWLTVPHALIATGQYTLVALVQSGQGTNRTLTLPVNIFSGSATFTTVYCNADTGSDATGNGTVGNPWESIDKAVESFAGTGDGGRIILQEATLAYGYRGTVLGTHTTPAVTTNRYLTISSAAGANKANVKVGLWNNAILGATKVRLRAVTVTTPIIGDGIATHLWLEDCHLQGTGSTVLVGPAGWTPNWQGGVYFTDGEWSTSQNGPSNIKLIRGATITGMGFAGWIPRSDQAILDSTIDSSVHGLFASTAVNYENMLAFNVSALNCTGVGFAFHTAALQTLTNAAFVNVLTESSGTNTFRDVALDHVILGNCGFNSGHFQWACAQPVRLSVRECVFQRMTQGGGDVVASPNMDALDSSFSDCHYIDGTTGQGFILGTNVTTGSAAYVNQGADDYTPATGSNLYDQHVAPQYIRCDQEGVARDNPTTVGPLRGNDEGGGSGEAPPSGLAYTPLKTQGVVGSAISAINPSYDGEATKFEIAPSIYHIYKAPEEIQCDASDAHFEIRAWEASDGLLANGQHHAFVVEDLRDNSDGLGGQKIYLKHPKLGDTEAFSPLALAINLGAPFASESPGVHLNGPWGQGIRPIIRIRGDISYGGLAFGAGFVGLDENTAKGIAVILGRGKQPTDTSGAPAGAFVGWAAVPGFGGFMPFSGTTSINGKGAPITVSLVGATGSKQDTVCGHSMSQGYKYPDGSWDETFAPLDVLYKDLIVSGIVGVDTVGNPGATPPKPPGGAIGIAGIINGQWGERTGRFRFYDCEFRAASFAVTHTWPPGTTSVPWGIGLKSYIRNATAAHYDLRRNVFNFANEHSCYADLINGGLFRDAGGKNADSWFIENVLPEGTPRSMFQFVDRCFDYAGQLGTPTNPPSLTLTKALPAGKGTVLFQGNRMLKGSSDAASYITMYSGADITWILRANEISQKGPLLGKAFPWGLPNPDTITHHKRGVVALDFGFNGGSWTPSAQPGNRYNENGYPIRRIVIIDHKDDTDNPTEKRLGFRGVEEVLIYSFKHTIGLGGPKADIDIDGADGTEYPPFYGQGSPSQFDLAGNLHYSNLITSGPKGTPISANGTLFPACGSVKLFMGFDKANPTTWKPTDYSGWLPPMIVSGVEVIQKMVGAIPPATQWGTFSNPIINGFRATPVFLPAGLSLNQSTGVVTGTPTEAMGIDFLTLQKLGTPIDSPFTYVTVGSSAGYARVPVRASNSSSADAWTPGEFHLHITNTGAGGLIVVHPPYARMSFGVPQNPNVAVDCLVAAPIAYMLIGCQTDTMQIDQEGATQTVRPPVARMLMRAQRGLTIEVPVNVAAPCAVMQFRAIVSDISVTGSSNHSDGPADGIGLRAGFEDGMGISV